MQEETTTGPILSSSPLSPMIGAVKGICLLVVALVQSCFCDPALANLSTVTVLPMISTTTLQLRTKLTDSRSLGVLPHNVLHMVCMFAGIAEGGVPLTSNSQMNCTTQTGHFLFPPCFRAASASLHYFFIVFCLDVALNIMISYCYIFVFRCRHNLTLLYKLLLKLLVLIPFVMPLLKLRCR